MIVSGQVRMVGSNSSSLLFSDFFRYLRLMIRELFLYLSAGAILISCSKSDQQTEKIEESVVRTFFCDAESLEGGRYLGKNTTFGHGETQSDAFAFEGNHSCMVGGKNPYGFELVIDQLHVGSYILVEVYQKADEPYDPEMYRKDMRYYNPIVVSNEDGSIYHRTFSDFENVNGWRKIVLEYTVEEPVEWLKAYIINEDSVPVYYDNFKVTVYDERPADGDGLPKLYLDFDEKDFAKLSHRASEARKLSILSKQMKKNVPVRIRFGDEIKKGKAKLKGDWADHVKYRKWSFRVNVKGSETINGQEIFSLHNPFARWFLNEWAAHRLMREEGIISPRYEFVQLHVNGENWGVYAMEEHFTKLLVEDMQYREGPIMKFDESGIWERREVALKNKTGSINLPVFKASMIDMFRTKKVLNDSTQYRQFLEAKNLMYCYQFGYQNIETILDIRKWAKYYAMCSILGMRHSTMWTNQRLYYNPITSLLEPIGYDCFTVHNPRHEEFWLNIHEGTSYGNIFSTLLFRNKKFLHHFEQEVQRISQKTQLAQFENLISEKWDEVKSAFDDEFPFYSPDLSYVHNRVAFLNDILDDYKRNFDSYEPRSEDPQFNCEDPYFLENVALQVFRQTRDSLNQTIALRNNHPCGITIIGYDDKDGTSTLFESPFEITDEDIELELTRSARILVYNAQNTPDSLYRKKINKWSKPERISTREQFIRTASNFRSVFKVDESAKTITIGPGKIRLNNHVYIPEGYRVYIERATSIDLINRASIISKSAVEARGDLHPIEITSSDGTGQGIHVLQTADTSIFSGVSFYNLNTLKYGNWHLTGAVTFYESPVILRNLMVNDILCEDGINVVRSWFDMAGCTIANAYSDGVDIDFGKGIVQDCIFSKNGNDGLDLSGSDAKVINCEFRNNGDKGISFGESSIGNATDCLFLSNGFGVASKDKSEVNILNSKFEKNTIALTAFQKKPEFGPSQLFARNCSFDQNQKDIETDPLSKIKRE